MQRRRALRLLLSRDRGDRAARVVRKCLRGLRGHLLVRLDKGSGAAWHLCKGSGAILILLALRRRRSAMLHANVLRRQLVLTVSVGRGRPAVWVWSPGGRLLQLRQRRSGSSS